MYLKVLFKDTSITEKYLTYFKYNSAIYNSHNNLLQEAECLHIG